MADHTLPTAADAAMPAARRSADDQVKQIHANLQAAYELMGQVRTQIADMHLLLGLDTAFACGEATGVLGKARALVGRDIDQLRATRAR